MADLAGLRAVGVGVAHLGRGLAAGVHDTHQVGLRAAVADDVVEGAVLRHQHVGDVVRGGRGVAEEGFRLREIFHRAYRVAAAHRLEVQCHDAAVVVVRDEERLLVLRRKPRVVAEGHSDRAAQADVVERGRGVLIPIGVLAGVGARAVAEVGRARHPHDAGRGVPRHTDLGFVVAVVGENLAIAVEGEVQWIAQAGSKEAEVLPVEIHLSDPAAEAVAAGLGGVRGTDAGLAGGGAERAAEGGNHAVVSGEAHRGVGRHLLRVIDHVAVDHVEGLSVRSGHDVVHPVIAVAAFGAVEPEEGLNLAEAAVLVRIAQALDAHVTGLAAERGIRLGVDNVVGAAAANVEAAVDPLGAHGLGNRGGDGLVLRDVAGLVQGQAGERLLLVGAENETALVVLGEADPSALHRAVGAGHDLHLETGEHLDDLVCVSRIVRGADRATTTCGGRSRERRRQRRQLPHLQGGETVGRSLHPGGAIGAGERQRQLGGSQGVDLVSDGRGRGERGFNDRGPGRGRRIKLRLHRCGQGTDGRLLGGGGHDERRARGDGGINPREIAATLGADDDGCSQQQRGRQGTDEGTGGMRHDDRGE